MKKRSSLVVLAMLTTTSIMPAKSFAKTSYSNQILELQAQMEKIDESDYVKKAELNELISEIFNQEIAAIDEVIALAESTTF